MSNVLVLSISIIQSDNAPEWRTCQGHHRPYEFPQTCGTLHISGHQPATFHVMVGWSGLDRINEVGIHNLCSPFKSDSPFMSKWGTLFQVRRLRHVKINDTVLVMSCKCKKKKPLICNVRLSNYLFNRGLSSSVFTSG